MGVSWPSRNRLSFVVYPLVRVPDAPAHCSAADPLRRAASRI